MVSERKSVSGHFFSPAMGAENQMESGRKTADSMSCYFPGCRKDANCSCEICIASINATLDLIPEGSSSRRSLQKSSITFSSPSLPTRRPRTPLQPPALSPSSSGSSPASRPLHSTAKSRAPPRNHTELPLPRKSRQYLTVFPFVILAAVCGFVILKTYILGGALLTPEIVKTAGEQAQGAGYLRQKLVSVENYLAEILGADRVFNCSGGSGWEFQQDGHLLTSKCVIFISAMEEVSVWGFPVQISRVISSGFSSRWLTVLSGRLTEWSREKLVFGELRSSAYYGRWETAVVHLEEETWVLEYRSSWLENWTDVIPRLGELLRARMSLPWRARCPIRYTGDKGDVSMAMVPS